MKKYEFANVNRPGQCGFCGDLYETGWKAQADETKLICNTCAHRTYSKCAFHLCKNKTVSSGNKGAQNKLEETYCEGCLVDNSFICAICETRNELHKRHIVPRIMINEEAEEVLACSKCVGRLYVRCGRCLQFVPKGDSGLGIEEGFDTESRRCRNCQVTIKGHNFKPVPAFRGNGPMYMGFELEIECTNMKKSLEHFAGELTKRMGGLIYCKRDGSIAHGFEVVSHPCDYDWYMNNRMAFEPIFELAKIGFVSYKTESCGMHVHLSKTPFTTAGLYRFLKVMYEYPAFVHAISRRKIKLLSQWASPVPGESIAHKARSKGQDEPKYTAANITENTVEVRIFRGTLLEAAFWRNIQFCQALFEYAHTTLKAAKVTPINFMEHVTEGTGNRFPELKTWLKENEQALTEATKTGPKAADPRKLYTEDGNCNCQDCRQQNKDKEIKKMKETIEATDDSQNI